MGTESGGQTPGGSELSTLFLVSESCSVSPSSRGGLTPSVSGELHSALVRLSPWLRPCNQMCVHGSVHSTPQLRAHAHTHAYVPFLNKELKPLAVRYHELTGLPSLHQVQLNSLCHLEPHEGVFSPPNSPLALWFRHA